MSDEDWWTPWLGRSGSRRRTAAFWMTIFFSLALIQVALPSLIHSRVVGRQMKRIAAVDVNDEETVIWTYPRPVQDDAVELELNRVQIKIVIASRNHQPHPLEKSLSSIFQQTGAKNCTKNARFSTMVLDMDPYGNDPFNKLAKKYKPKECFEFYRNNSRLYSKLFKTSSETLQSQRSIEFANLLFTISRFHPDFHILMMADDIMLCPNDSVYRIQRAAAIADDAGEFGIILPTAGHKDGIPAAVIISRYISLELSDYIAKSAEKLTVIDAIMEFIATRQLPSFSSKAVLAGTAFEDGDHVCDAKVDLDDVCEVDSPKQLRSINFNKLNCNS